MARLPSQGKKVTAGPASKLQRVKVGKAALVAPACPPGCAVVSADLLHQLQEAAWPRKEVKATHIPPEPKSEGPDAKSRAVPARPAPRRQKDPGIQAAPVKTVAANINDEVPPPPGARHASVGTVQAVEEGTQTSMEDNKAAALLPGPAPVPQAAPLPPSAREDAAARAVPNAGRHRGHGPSEATAAQPAEALQNYGLCDPFHLDRITAEKDRDRKRVQAQMLAEQIQEQRERKEEELRRQREEELMEERRVARELREIEDRHRREQAAIATKAASPEVPKVPGPRAPGQGPVRRRRSKDPSGQDFSPSRGAGTYDGSTAGTWVDGEDRRRRRRRRRRDVDSTTGQEGSWRASERDKRTWRDENYSSLSLLPDGRDTSSPVPWMTASPQEHADGPDGLSTVLETGEMKRTEARPVRGRRRRERRDFRERGDSYDENDTWESAQNRKSQDDIHPPRVPVVDGANWPRDPDDEQRRRRGRAQPPLAPRREHMGTLEEVPPLPAPVEKDRSPRPPAPMMSEAELREIRSLVRVCEQLLRERAEEKEKEREADRARAKGSPKQSLSPAARKTDRLSPSRLASRIPSRHGSSKQETSEEVPRLTTGAALASARSQATKNSHTSGIGASASPSVEAGAAGAGASDMHSWGAREEPQVVQGPQGDPGEWSSDALMELMHNHSRMVGVDARLPGMDIPEGQVVYEAMPPVAPSGEAAPSGSRMPPLSSLADSPFTSPARGVALRRSSRRESRGGLGDPNSVFRSWGGRMLASPPPISRGGLNVQASWEPLGYDQGGRPFHPFHKGSRHAGHRGPGQVPIGINPSIQAQSAMLREMYPNVAMGGPGPGPLSFGPTG